MTTLELIQLQNEHKDNFFTQGDDCERARILKQRDFKRDSENRIPIVYNI